MSDDGGYFDRLGGRRRVFRRRMRRRIGRRRSWRRNKGRLLGAEIKQVRERGSLASLSPVKRVFEFACVDRQFLLVQDAVGQAELAQPFPGAHVWLETEPVAEGAALEAFRDALLAWHP